MVSRVIGRGCGIIIKGVIHIIIHIEIQAHVETMLVHILVFPIHCSLVFVQVFVCTSHQALILVGTISKYGRIGNGLLWLLCRDAEP